MIPEDHSEIQIVPDEQRDVWLTPEQRKEPKRTPTNKELFDALARKRKREENES